MKIAIKIALIWLLIFDKHRLLFKSIKPLNKYFRWFMYIATNIAFYFFINFMEKISISFIVSYNFDSTVESIIISMFGFFKILSMIFMFGFFFLEFIIDFDIETYQKEKEDKENYIRANKLQWWRLRNCNWFFRILIYTVIFIFCFLMLLNSFLLSGNDRPLDFVAFGTFLKQFLLVYVIVFMLFDYKLVQKARKKVLQITNEVGEKV
ncbi:hypothetical protein QT384_00795 [Arcobacter cryaerophilus gv. pseudocryaerophilus]|uniref:Uncharacterized protein n=3 Tax=Arcobacteraceae TaxID=2808963 RepID=A0AA96DTZ6_9BACT|nr:hypothetical protein RMP68_00875 [Arcobacter sp. AZ-2023]WNL36346.1 hypothetical protein RMQ66_00795 [Arcobacter sp. AZ-2023]WPD12062.1 hypothetical protein QT384_00795 [Arcobacter sp. DSM 115960]